jgi:RNA polymerase sigma-70 factor (ECF subfamily)
VTPSLLHAQLEALYPRAWRWALHCARWDRELASDALHDAFEALLGGRLQPRDPGAWAAFVMAVVDRHVRRHRRWRALSRWVPWADDAVPADPGPGPDQAGEAAMLQRALSGLSRRQADIAWLVLACDLRVEDAASTLGLTVGTARTHYARAKRRLRDLLGDPGDD